MFPHLLRCLREGIRHATLLAAPKMWSENNRRGIKEKIMNQENETVSAAQIQERAEEYKRLFGPGKTLDKQIQQWAEDYKRLFETERSVDEQREKIAKLKAYRKDLVAKNDLLDKIIAYIENRLGELSVQS